MVMQASTERAFEFGQNWRKFLTLLSDKRIEAAEHSLLSMLQVDTLAGKSFLDIGSGSGLFSLAARRCGAKVHSFDFDRDSFACTMELKRRCRPGDDQWTIDHASVLDKDYLKSLGTFDVVYSWGVLHHTGKMWQAIDNAQELVAPGGQLFIAIYNNQGGWSTRWKWIKRIYHMLPPLLRPAYVVLVALPREILQAVYMCVALKPRPYIQSWTQYEATRGMNRWHDAVDWIGGWPFEVAKPEEIFDFLKRRGFMLQTLTTAGGGHGCNEFVFVKLPQQRTGHKSVAWNKESVGMSAVPG